MKKGLPCLVGALFLLIFFAGPSWAKDYNVIWNDLGEPVQRLMISAYTGGFNNGTVTFERTYGKIFKRSLSPEESSNTLEYLKTYSADVDYNRYFLKEYMDYVYKDKKYADIALFETLLLGNMCFHAGKTLKDCKSNFDGAAKQFFRK